MFRFRQVVPVVQIAGIILGISCVVAVYVYAYVRSDTSQAVGVIDAVTMHQAYATDPKLYAILDPSTYTQVHAVPVFGGIVSHHLLANIDISKFWLEFTDQPITRVVLIGPNHYYPGAPAIVTTRGTYTTPFGDVSVDAAVADDLVAMQVAVLSPQTFDDEHSMSSLVPYVAAYFPEAQIVPLVISKRASESELLALAQYLSEIRDSGTIVVASVDFSHHLQQNATTLHDNRSVAAITSFDTSSLFELEVDSPGSLFTLLEYLKSAGAQKLSFWQQSAATIFDVYDSEDVTSYMFMHATQGTTTPTSAVSALFFGDALLGRGVADRPALLGKLRGPEGNFMKGHDAVMVNLEGALKRPGCTEVNDELLISPPALSLLAKNHVTHVGIENNHFSLCPRDVASDAVLADYRLLPVGNEPVIVSGTNRTLGLLSFFAAPIPSDTRVLREAVATLKQSVDSVVVNLHWGNEYSNVPSEAERALAHELIDAGASVIIGHHPHVVQPAEFYNGGVVFYSLGNMVADQVGADTQSGIAVGIFDTESRLEVTAFPFTDTSSTPTLLTQSKARAVCASLYENALSVQSSKHPCVLEIPR